jgi:hypothetical protein
MVQATESQIAMWRSAIALAWANGTLDEGEKALLLQYFKDNIYLTDAQRAQLIKDMEHKIELGDVWGSISDAQDRAHLIDIAPSLFSKHGTPTPEERALYDKMFADQMATVDTKKLQQEIGAIKAHIPIEKQEIEKEYAKDFNNFGPIGRMIYHFNKMLGLEPY